MSLPLDPPGGPPRAAASRAREEDLRAFRESLLGEAPAPPTLRSAWLNVLLFALTAGSIYVVGGPLMAVGLLSILVAHEMGHYVMCRRYGVDATLPFFIPFPIEMGFGTLGAFIRMRSHIPDRRALMDIGVSGPLAGFLVCLPVLALGALEAKFAPADLNPYAVHMGEPLLFQWAIQLLRGPTPEGMDVYIGPLGRAAWFGLFVTALNLMPIGQLDGGHMAYALVRERYRWVSRAGLAACLVLLYFRPTWLLWTLLLLALGRRHPPTRHDERPLNPGRVALGVLGFMVFAVCFTPNPALITWSDFLEAWRALFALGLETLRGVFGLAFTSR